METREFYLSYLRVFSLRANNLDDKFGFHASFWNQRPKTEEKNSHFLAEKLKESLVVSDFISRRIAGQLKTSFYVGRPSS